jgi:hypothetical protein
LVPVAWKRVEAGATITLKELQAAFDEEATRGFYLFWAFSGVTRVDEQMAERPSYNHLTVLEQLADETHRCSHFC